MAFNPFLGWTQTQLETALAAAQADYARGKTITRADVPGVSAYSQLEQTIVERIRVILVALNKLDSVTYPSDQIAQASTTRAVFS